MDNENEKGAVSPTPQSKTPNAIIQASGKDLKAFERSREKRGWRPYVERPENVRDAVTKLNHSIRDWEKSTEQKIWEWGCWCHWIKDTVPHGQFENTIKKVTFKSVRGARYAMTYIDQCEEAGAVISYHPNPRVKSATVAVLELPIVDEKDLPKAKKPEKTVEWTVDNLVDELLRLFMKVTRSCDEGMLKDVTSQYLHAIQEHVKERTGELYDEIVAEHADSLPREYEENKNGYEGKKAE